MLVMQLAKEDKLEEALYLWLIQKRSQGTAISGPLLAEKASELHQKMELDSEVLQASQNKRIVSPRRETFCRFHCY